MTWLLEDPMPVVYLAAVVEAALVVAFVKTGRGRLLWAMGGVLLVGGAIVLVSWLIETDREQVQGVLTRAAAAVESNDVDGVLAEVAPGTRIASRARSVMARHRFGRVALFDEPKIAVEGDNAQAAVNVVAVVDGFRGGRLVKVSLRREADRWLIVEAQDEAIDLRDVFR